MKTTLTQSNFVDGMNAVRPDNFSYEGLNALYDYLTQMEEDCGDEYEMEFDPIAICCDFSEFDNLREAFLNYKTIDDLDGVSFEDQDMQAREYLHDNTSLIEFNGGVIIQDF